MEAQLSQYAATHHAGLQPHYEVSQDRSNADEPLYGVLLRLPWTAETFNVPAIMPTIADARGRAAHLALRSSACRESVQVPATPTTDDKISTLFQECQRLDSAQPDFNFTTDVRTMLWGCICHVEIKGKVFHQQIPDIHRAKKAAKNAVAGMILSDILHHFPRPSEPMDIDDISTERSPVAVLQEAMMAKYKRSVATYTNTAGDIRGRGASLFGCELLLDLPSGRRHFRVECLYISKKAAKSEVAYKAIEAGMLREIRNPGSQASVQASVPESPTFSITTQRPMPEQPRLATPIFSTQPPLHQPTHRPPQFNYPPQSVSSGSGSLHFSDLGSRIDVQSDDSASLVNSVLTSVSAPILRDQIQHDFWPAPASFRSLPMNAIRRDAGLDRAGAEAPSAVGTKPPPIVDAGSAPSRSTLAATDYLYTSYVDLVAAIARFSASSDPKYTFKPVGSKIACQVELPLKTSSGDVGAIIIPFGEAFHSGDEARSATAELAITKYNYSEQAPRMRHTAMTPSMERLDWLCCHSRSQPRPVYGIKTVENDRLSVALTIGSQRFSIKERSYPTSEEGMEMLARKVLKHLEKDFPDNATMDTRA